jgi:uncharacterized protein YukE
MAQPVDAPALVALEVQLRELRAVLARLESARRELVPPPAAFWSGDARRAYDRALAAIGRTTDDVIGAVAQAARRTADSVERMRAGV